MGVRGFEKFNPHHPTLLSTVSRIFLEKIQVVYTITLSSTVISCTAIVCSVYTNNWLLYI